MAAPGAPFSQRALGNCLALFRVFIGIKFLTLGYSKLGMLHSHMMATMLTQWGTDPKNPFHSYQQFLLHTAVPNSDIFTILVITGEMTVGFALILGLATRFAALVGFVMNANYLLATASIGSAWLVNQTFMAIELLFFFTAAGRILGFDAILARRFPHFPAW